MLKIAMRVMTMIIMIEGDVKDVFDSLHSRYEARQISLEV